MTLARAVCEAVDGIVSAVNLYDAEIAPCRACGACAKGSFHPCPLTDGFPKVLDALLTSDAVIVASPLHFTSLTAPVIATYSRLQPYWAMQSDDCRSGVRLREGALVVTAGSEYAGMFQPSRSVTAAVFNTLGIHFAGMVTAANTDSKPLVENTVALEEAQTLGEQMRKCMISHASNR